MEQPTGQIYNLFPTRIWRVQLNDLAPHFSDWVAAIDALRAASPVPVGGSNRQGWNSNERAILHQPIFAPLHKAARAVCLSAFEQMGLPNPAFELESWVNVNDRGGYNIQHMHYGMISGCFYLRAPEGAGSIVFRDPRLAVETSYLKGPGINSFMDFPIQPETGMLLLFPSWLHHRVEPHNNDIPRISISFNALWR
jgi:uncharacterized protein (TIGR02466 family)